MTMEPRELPVASGGGGGDEDFSRRLAACMFGGVLG